MNTTAFPKILALDFGTERIGVALSYGTLAEPLKIIPNDPTTMQQIQELITEHGVTQLVVGISESKTAQRTIAFVAELKKQFSLDIQLIDETLSTQVVRKKLRETGKTAYEVSKAKVDHLAAAELLQDWIDSN
jgi:putative transcription antitermination factor YqgF